MADVKWIKLMVDVFSNRKIEQIEVMPEGDGIIVIWMKLLCLAGNINDDGAIYFTNELPYTEEMLAAHFHRPLQLVRLALRIFAQFGMIEIVENIIHISNWAKYQNTERMSELREYNRLAKQRSRERKRLMSNNVNDMSMTCQRSQDTDIEEEEEVEVEVEVDKNKSKKILIAQSDAPAPAYTLPLNDGTEHPITTEDIKKYESLYPAVDVMQELRNMCGWLDSNPTRNKTKNGIKRFINSWLSREQDKGVRWNKPKSNTLDILNRMAEE